MVNTPLGFRTPTDDEAVYLGAAAIRNLAGDVDTYLGNRNKARRRWVNVRNTDGTSGSDIWQSHVGVTVSAADCQPGLYLITPTLLITNGSGASALCRARSVAGADISGQVWRTVESGEYDGFALSFTSEVKVAAQTVFDAQMMCNRPIQYRSGSYIVVARVVDY